MRAPCASTGWCQIDDDTRRQRKNTLEEEKELLEEVNLERKGLEATEADLVKVRADLQEEKNNAAAAIGGEETLRHEYEASLGKQRECRLSRRLTGYGNEVASTSTQAKGLVGRIAFDSFRRVQASFYELVLEADVDVAFIRKQDKTLEIQKFVNQKDPSSSSLMTRLWALKDVD